MTLTYNPKIFDVSNIAEAQHIILTPEPGLTVEERWRSETPYLVEQIMRLAGPILGGTRVLDYGCGIGRLSKALIEATGCLVIGIDQSTSMRALAAHYVNDARFMACHPVLMPALDLRCDVAISVWTLQHCLKPAEDIANIRSALRERGRLFVLNMSGRAVPTSEQGWVNDGVDVQQILRTAFEVVVEEKPTAPISPLMIDCSFMGAYRVVS